MQNTSKMTDSVTCSTASTFSAQSVPVSVFMDIVHSDQPLSASSPTLSTAFSCSYSSSCSTASTACYSDSNSHNPSPPTLQYIFTPTLTAASAMLIMHTYCKSVFTTVPLSFSENIISSHLSPIYEYIFDQHNVYNDPRFFPYEQSHVLRNTCENEHTPLTCFGAVFFSLNFSLLNMLLPFRKNSWSDHSSDVQREQLLIKF